MCKKLQAEGVFYRNVDSSQIAFHSPKMALVRQPMLSAMQSVVTEPKQRSPKWISTSVPEERWNEDSALLCSAEYHVNNACSSVLFYEALQKVPSNAIIIEIAPHCLFQTILRRCLPTSTSIGMVNKSNEMNSFLEVFSPNFPAKLSY